MRSRLQPRNSAARRFVTIRRRMRPQTDVHPTRSAPPWRDSGRSRAAETRTPETAGARRARTSRSEEHTSELQSRLHLVCRLLLEKKKKPRDGKDGSCTESKESRAGPQEQRAPYEQTRY